MHVVQSRTPSEDQQARLAVGTAHSVPNWLQLKLACPACKGSLNATTSGWSCLRCNRDYPLRHGIPDFRLAPDPYISIDDELAKIETLFSGPRKSFRALLSAYYALSPENPPSLNKHYVGAMEAAVTRGRGVLRRHATLFPSCGKSALLDLGCGTAGLLASAPEFFRHSVGADVALRWLLIGKERLRELGVEAPLLCANAESLPFAEGAFDAVVGDAVVEHVRDVRSLRDETLRVLASEGSFFFVTNNRYSILPEPHVRIPAFGLLPRAAMSRVAWTLRKTPYHVRLMSLQELARVFHGVGKISLPWYSAGDLGQRNERLRRIWERASRWRFVRALLWPVVPQYFVSGSKAAGYREKRAAFEASPR